MTQKESVGKPFLLKVVEPNRKSEGFFVQNNLTPKVSTRNGLTRHSVADIMNCCKKKDQILSVPNTIYAFKINEIKFF